MLNLNVQDMSAFCKTASPDGPAYMKAAYNLSASGRQDAAKNTATITQAGPEMTLGR